MNDDNYEFYQKIHAYLLDHGQQELAGHFDRIWQDLVKVTREQPDDEIESVALKEGATPEEKPLDKRTQQGMSGFGYKD